MVRSVGFRFGNLRRSAVRQSRNSVEVVTAQKCPFFLFRPELRHRFVFFRARHRRSFLFWFMSRTDITRKSGTADS